jgi:ribosome-associated protein
LDPREFAKKIARLGLEKKGKQIVLIDLRKVSGIADFFVIMSGTSDTQVKALADHIMKKLRDDKIKIYHKEGFHSLRWVLLDYVDVIVHIFQNETREFYGLERLWGDAHLEFVMDEEHDRRTVHSK